MIKTLRLAGLMLLLGLSTLYALEPASSHPVPADEALHVTILYDNYQLDQNLKPDWGFACLLEYQGYQLLFDAGSNAAIYQQNAAGLHIDPKTIPALFISHAHGDHTAAIPWILESNPSIRCFLPTPYAKQLITGEKLSANCQYVPEAMHLHGPFYSTGDNFAAFREQGLVVKTTDGGVLITGCGHPGVVEMVSKVSNELGIEIHTVIGGLHLMQSPGNRVNQIADELKAMGIKQICPTHCTGDQSIAVFNEAFGEAFIPGGTGKEIVIL